MSRGLCFEPACPSAEAAPVLPLVFTVALAFVVPALLPGVKLCHDRVLCAHDLERLDRPHWQREPDRRGAEVGPAGCHTAARGRGAASPRVKAAWQARLSVFIGETIKSLLYLYPF